MLNGLSRADFVGLPFMATATRLTDQHKVTAGTFLSQPAARQLIADITVVNFMNAHAAAFTAGGNVRGKADSAAGIACSDAGDGHVMPAMAVRNKAKEV